MSKQFSLAEKNPILATQWHPNKNGSLTPYDVSEFSHSKVWWLLPYDDPNTGKHFDFEWQMDVASRSSGAGCPFLSGKRVWKGYNDLSTTNPGLAAQWHPTKNGDVAPTDVTSGSGKKVWWRLPYDDPKTGKHFDFEWQATIAQRSSGNECPYISGKKVWKGFNDLGTTNPDLAAQWHPKKNDSLTPYDVTQNSNANVWWLMPYDDPKTGKHFEFEWQSSVANRNLGEGCPFLVGKKVWRGFNDLASTNPELIEQWHPAKNGGLTPFSITAGSGQKIWWISNVRDAVSDVADTIKSYLHFSVPDEGPLTEYEKWMPDFMKGLAEGIEKSKGLVADAISGVSADMVVNPTVDANANIQRNQTAQTNALGGIMSDIRSLVNSIGSMNTDGGDIVVPVYIGGSQID